MDPLTETTTTAPTLPVPTDYPLSEALLDCPVCDGVGFRRKTRVPCLACLTSGKLTMEQFAQIDAGAALKRDMERRGVQNLHEEASRLGMDWRELQDKMRGYSTDKQLIALCRLQEREATHAGN